MDILQMILGPIADYLVEPIGRQFDYLFCYRSNIANLESEYVKLINKKHGVEQRRDVDRRNLQNIALHIQEWLKDVDTVNSEVARILERKQRVEEGCLNGWCPKVKSRYMLSRTAKKKIEEVVKLQNEAKDYASFSLPERSSGLDSVAVGASVEFESRKFVEEKVISALKDKNVTMIGLCGMGGVGKTLMAKKIGKIMKNENIFHEVVMAVVGHEPVSKIQSEIADGLRLNLEVESLLVRAGRLYTRIMDAKKILIILDDVWRWLDLSELGIPSPGIHKGCKILLTSRLRNVCTDMGAKEIFTIAVLPEAEAWSLFKENVGNTVEDPRLLHIPIDIALECKGLPIALVTVGQALRNRSESYWKDALLQLKKALPTNIAGVLPDVYRPLELSYTFLESDEARTLFLMCCLFPEDAYIPVDILVRFGMGLDIFSGVENLKEARNRVHVLVEMLKNHFLLVDNDEENYVQMHDVVRDVAVFIAKHMFLISHDINSKKWPRTHSYKNFTCISIISGAFDELPESLDCPKLEMLMLECNFQPLKAADSFFTGMQGLKVLEMRDFYMPSLPSSLRLCTSLRTLQLHCCEFVKEISDAEEDKSEEVLSMIAQLVNLEILSFSYSSVKALPSAVRNLRNLRLLDLTGCKHLNVIQPGIISCLVGLEEIYLKRSFANWGEKIEGKEGRNVSLVELESLLNLTTLQILIPEAHLIPKNLHLSPMLTKYDLSIGLPSEMGKEIQNEIGQHYEKILCLSLPFAHSFVGSFLYVLMNAEYLYSRGEGSDSAIEALASEGFQNLKQLHLDACSSVQHLASTKDWIPANHGPIFPLLEKISLFAASCLKEICHGQLPAGSFAKLRHLDFRLLPMLMHLWKSPNQDISLANLVFISLDECHRLENLFSLSIAQTLLQLEQLKVTKCSMMAEIVSDKGAAAENGSTSNEIQFPKLRYLGLGKLWNFNRFCKWIDRIQFPRLSQLRLNSLPKLKCFFCKEDGFDSGVHYETDEVHSLFDQQKSLPTLQMLELSKLASVTNLWSRKLATGFFSPLEELKVISCPGLKNLFSSSIAKGLVNLKELEIQDCSAMEEIIEKDEEEDKGEEKSKLSLFPQLKMLKLLTLEDLKRFCHLKHDLEMELLEYLEIRNCPKLSTFNPGSIKTPNLRVLKVDDLQIEKNDLNSALQQHSQAKDEICPEKNYFMCPATDLSITSGADSRYWDWPIMKESSGQPFVVAELLKVLSLDVRGSFETVNLSPGVTYEVAFVIMLREPTKGFEEPVNLRLILPNGTITDRTEYLKAKPRGRWIELELGDFEVSPDETGAIEFCLLQHTTSAVKKGLVIKGVIIRPKPLNKTRLMEFFTK